MLALDGIRVSEAPQRSPAAPPTCSAARATSTWKSLASRHPVLSGESDNLPNDRLGELSATIRERVESARSFQRERFAGTKLMCNADMGPSEVREFRQLDGAGRSLLRAAMTPLSMSARAFHRILRLSRTIADLEGTPDIQTQHLAEAIQYRPRRQMQWPFQSGLRDLPRKLREDRAACAALSRPAHRRWTPNRSLREWSVRHDAWHESAAIDSLEAWPKSVTIGSLL